MSIKKVTILFLCAFFFQMSLCNLIAIHSITPNLLLCLTVVIIFRYEHGFRCIPFAIVAGLLLDICIGSYVGVTPLAIFITAIGVTWVRGYLNTSLYKTMIAVGVAATLVFDLVSWALMAILQSGYGFLYMAKVQIPFILYNSAFMALLFFLESDRFKNWLARHRQEMEEEEA